MDTDAASLAWFLGWGVAFPVVLVALAFRSPTPRQVRRWSEVVQVEIVPANEPLVRDHLGRARRFRAVAAMPFWWLPVAPVVFGTDFPELVATPYPVFLAYVGGAVVAELAARPEGVDGPRQAVLLPRSVEDFRPAWLRAATVWLLAAGVAMLLVGMAVSTPTDRLAEAVPTVVVAVGLLGLTDAVAHRVVGRAQRGADPAVLAADDGLRATAVSMTSCVAFLGGITSAFAALAALLPEAPGWWALLTVPAWFAGSAVGVAAISVIVRQETLGYRLRHRLEPAAV